MELAIVWLACGAICYGLAINKKKNPFIAFGVGILFGVFSVIYYLFCKGSKEYEIEKAEKKIKEMS